MKAIEDGLDDTVAAGGVEQKGAGARSSCALHQLRPQHLVRSVQSDLHVGITEGQNLRGFRCTHFFKVAQNENGTVSDRERKNGFLKQRSEFSASGVAFGSG